MSFEERRIHERRPFVETIRYFVSMSELEKIDNLEEIYNEAVSVDISEGGLAMVTPFPLKKGDILFFEHEIKIEDVKTMASIVRWVREIEHNRHLVGMEFFAYIDRTLTVQKQKKTQKATL